jgi:hypothetical protein
VAGAVALTAPIERNTVATVLHRQACPAEVVASARGALPDAGRTLPAFQRCEGVPYRVLLFDPKSAHSGQA